MNEQEQRELRLTLEEARGEALAAEAEAREVERSLVLAAMKAENELDSRIANQMCPDLELAQERKLCQGCHYFALYTSRLKVENDGGKVTFSKGYKFHCTKFNQEVAPLGTESCFEIWKGVSK